MKNYSNIKKWIYCAALLLLFGCTSEPEVAVPEHIKDLDNLTVYPTDPQPAREIQLEREQTFGSREEILIGRMGDIAVDSSGRVFIADIQNQSIHVFHPDGRFIAQLGREGRGPSEFGFIKSLQIRNNRLYAYDFYQYKVSVFTLDPLAGDQTILLAQNRGKYRALDRAYPSIDQLYVRNNNTYLAKFKSDSSKTNKRWQNFEIKGLFYLLDSTGKIVSEKLLDLKVATGTHVGTSSSSALLGYHMEDFFGNVMPVLSRDNWIYLAEPDLFLIKAYSPNGVYKHAFYYPHKKIPLTRKSAIEARVSDLFIRNMQSMDLPQTWPVLTEMKIDDQDRLWIATTVEDMNVYEWWVLDAPDGSLWAKFDWLRDKPIEVIKDGKLYTRETEKETGLEEIVRYNIEIIENQ